MIYQRNLWFFDNVHYIYIRLCGFVPNLLQYIDVCYSMLYMSSFCAKSDAIYAAKWICVQPRWNLHALTRSTARKPCLPVVAITPYLGGFNARLMRTVWHGLRPKVAALHTGGHPQSAVYHWLIACRVYARVYNRSLCPCRDSLQRCIGRQTRWLQRLRYECAVVMQSRCALAFIQNNLCTVI